MERPDRPPRILLCSPSTGYGGIERRMVQEAALLRELGCAVTAATPPFDGREAWHSAMQTAGAGIIDWTPPRFIEDWSGRHPGRLRAWWQARGLRRARYDLAHVFFSWTTYGASYAWVAARAGIPLLISTHGAYPKAELHPWIRARLREAFAGLIGGYAVSGLSRRTFLDNVGDCLPNGADLRVIRNGIDANRFRPDAAARAATRRRLGLDDRAFVVAFAGRLEPIKQPEVALRIIAPMPAAHLLVLGDGPLLPALQSEAAAPGIAGRVAFTGRVDDPERWLAGADALIACSKAEGFALGVAEALAAGLPVLLPDHSVYPELYGACAAASFYPVDRPADGTVTLMRLMARGVPERAALAEAARSPMTLILFIGRSAPDSISNTTRRSSSFMIMDGEPISKSPRYRLGT